MDRINSAIAKARASRENLDGSRPPRPVSEHKATSANADWASLPEFQIAPEILDKSHIVAHRADAASTPFDLMRSSLLHQLQHHGWTRVAITSPDSGCGKTTVTLNLAFSLARMSDLRVMVLELDLRRPAMGRALGLGPGQDRKPQFSTALQGTVPPETQLLRYGHNLAFGFSSAPVDSPAELLSSVRAATIVDALEASFRPDIILFDMPPLIAGDDTFAFLDQIDCALVVAAAEETSVNVIDQCGKDLAERTQVLGVILNKCRMMDPDNIYG